MRISKTFICTAASALLLAAASNSFAGTITPATSPSPQPSFSPGSAVSNNSIGLQQTSASVVKILGNATITPGAGAHTVTLTLSGTFTANTNDIASFAYNFNIALNSATPATFTLSVTANATNPVPATLTKSTSPQTIPANSNQLYSGRDQTSAAPFGASGNFSGVLTLNFAAGTTAADTLTLTIPGQSIDFAVAPTAIPEPSTYALLGVGLVGLATRLRRRA